MTRTAGPTLNAKGYLVRRVRSHPTASKGGLVYEHRRVLYDTIGPGTHPCFWCLSPVSWEAPNGDPNRLVVDHLNSDRADNRPENLVPSCHGDNVSRRNKPWLPGQLAVGATA